MGQALSSYAPCCSGNAQEYEESVESCQKAVPNNNNLQWKEKIKTNKDSIVLFVDPKEEIAADRKKILVNLSIENWKE